ncbi:MAG: right-handed parallel beta-helix repeat-containing protein, partial [Candidatus Bathyarchaeota archaeon]
MYYIEIIEASYCTLIIRKMNKICMQHRPQQVLLTLLLILALPTTLTIGFILPANAATLRVPLEYPTIQAAVNAAASGDIIEVDAGTYFENVIVNQTVTIQGFSATSTIVDGGGTNVVFYIQEDNVELRDLTIQNGGTYSGVIIYYPNNALTIRNTRIVNNAVGIVVSEVDDNLFENNVFINNQMYGIDLVYSSNTIIRDNQ